MSTRVKTASRTRKTAEIIDPPTGPPPLLIFRPTLPPSKPPPLPSKKDKNKIEYIYDYSHEDLNGVDFSGLNGDNKYFASRSYENDAIVYAPFKGSIANFEGSNLTKANFSDSQLAYVKFDGATLNVANFSNSQVLKTSFIGAIADNIIFEDATIIESDFSNAQLRRANFKNVYFKKGSLNGNTSFTRADLTDADFSKNEDEIREKTIAYYEDDIKRLEAMAALPTTTAAKKKTIKDTINLRYNVIESESGTKGFNRGPVDDLFEYSGDFEFKHKSTASIMIISAVNFSNANLTRTNFSGCKFRQVNFRRANLTGANFTGADLSGTDFVGAFNLDKAIFDGAINIPPFLKKLIDEQISISSAKNVFVVAENKKLPPDVEREITSYLVGEEIRQTPSFKKMEKNTKNFYRKLRKTTIPIPGSSTKRKFGEEGPYTKKQKIEEEGEMEIGGRKTRRKRHRRKSRKNRK